MDKNKLSKLIKDGCTIKQISIFMNKGQTTVRYWLKKYNLKTTFRRQRWSDKDMKHALSKFNTISDVLKYLGLSVRPGNYETVNKYIKEHNIDISHITGKSSGRGGTPSISIEDALVKNSTYSRSNLKKRLLKEGLLGNKCSMKNCPSPNPEWKGEKLVLILDHINGINDDNRLENLRFVCPNCASQLSTHCGKNKKIEKAIFNCIKCNKKLNYKSQFGLCIKCYGKEKRICVRPNKKQLLSEIKELGYSGAGKKYGVSDNSIRKWIK